MKRTCQKYKAAFGLLDLLASLAALVCIAGLLLPMMSRSRGRADHSRLRCVSNLKSIGIGFRLYANDGAPYPSFYPTNEAWTYFQIVSQEIGSPKMLICPADAKKQSALDFETNGAITSFSFATNQNSALSYFYGAKADETKPDLFLAGDRNLKFRGGFTNILTLQSNSPVQWTQGIHTNQGNVVLLDGSAQQLTTKRLRSALESAPLSLETQTLVLP